MPVGEGKATMSAAVPVAIKERFQRIADQKRWTLSQTIVIFAEEYLSQWETELGIEKPSDSQAKS